jgi:hypothetical protein
MGVFPSGIAIFKSATPRAWSIPDPPATRTPLEKQASESNLSAITREAHMDRYTKTLLTIIAVALVGLLAVQLTPSAHAQVTSMGVV